MKGKQTQTNTNNNNNKNNNNNNNNKNNNNNNNNNIDNNNNTKSKNILSRKHRFGTCLCILFTLSIIKMGITWVRLVDNENMLTTTRTTTTRNTFVLEKQKYTKSTNNQLTLQLNNGKQALKSIETITSDSFLDLRKEMKQNAQQYFNTTNTSTTSTSSSSNNNNSNNTELLLWEEAMIGRELIWKRLQEAGIEQIDVVTLLNLPTWEEVTSTYGDHPIIYGLETCKDFRTNVPSNDAYIGVAGLYNTGTNALKLYLLANLQMPRTTTTTITTTTTTTTTTNHHHNNKNKNKNKNRNPKKKKNRNHNDEYGILGNVPWHKHWMASYRFNHTGPTFQKGGNTYITHCYDP